MLKIKNEFGNEIEVSAFRKDKNLIEYTLKGPNSEVTNEITILEAKCLTEELTMCF